VILFFTKFLQHLSISCKHLHISSLPSLITFLNSFCNQFIHFLFRVIIVHVKLLGVGTHEEPKLVLFHYSWGPERAIMLLPKSPLNRLLKLFEVIWRVQRNIPWAVLLLFAVVNVLLKLVCLLLRLLWALWKAHQKNLLKKSGVVYNAKGIHYSLSSHYLLWKLLRKLFHTIKQLRFPSFIVLFIEHENSIEILRLNEFDEGSEGWGVVFDFILG